MANRDGAPAPARHKQLSAQMVRECQADDSWSLGNELLYDLCRTYPAHSSVREVVAKVWLIGRAYSATVERGRGDAAGPGLTNDAFYIQAVAPALISSALDARLRSLADITQITLETVGSALETHSLLVTELTKLTKLTGRAKRSFASKYLHFHLPQIFFIYDARASNAVGKLGLRRTRFAHVAGVDAEYAAFVAALLSLRDRIVDQFGVALTPRQLDRLLLMIALA